jgi:hypothetical protein
MCRVFITPFEFQQFLATSPQVWGIIDLGGQRSPYFNQKVKFGSKALTSLTSLTSVMPRENDKSLLPGINQAQIRGIIYWRSQEWYRVMEILVTIDQLTQCVIWRTLTYLALVESIHQDYTRNRFTLSYAVKNLDAWSRRTIASARYQALGITPTFSYMWVGQSQVYSNVYAVMKDFVYLYVHAILRGWRQPIKTSHRRMYSFGDTCYFNPIRDEIATLGRQFNTTLGY